MAKTWILLGAMIAALLGAVPAEAGIAIDNTVVLDPYDPVPPIQFSHWYGGYGCERECGQHCWHSCYRHTDCDERCGDRDRCEHDCYRHCDDRGCYTQNDNDRDYDHDNDRRTQANAIPCTTGDCYESENWEHKWRDGDHVSREWLDRGRKEGTDYDNSYYNNDRSYYGNSRN